MQSRLSRDFPKALPTQRATTGKYHQIQESVAEQDQSQSTGERPPRLARSGWPGNSCGEHAHGYRGTSLMRRGGGGCFSWARYPCSGLTNRQSHSLQAVAEHQGVPKSVAHTAGNQGQMSHRQRRANTFAKSKRLSVVLPAGARLSPYCIAYRGTSLIRNTHPPRITIGPQA